MSVKVSVLTPVYNTEKYIGAAIESILAQSFQDFEMIICDDCSKDGTWKILESYAAKDCRIRLVKNEKNLGIAGNRNKLITLAQGEYIVWQDADDISMPLRIEHQLRYLESHPEVGIIGGYLQFFEDDRDLSLRVYATDDKDLRRTIFRYSPVAQPAAMIRLSCVREAGEYNLKFPPAEDLDMSFRIGSKHRFANLPEVVIRYREHSNSATFKHLKKMEKSTMEIRKIYSRGWGYRMTLGDRIYNLLQLISMYTMPARFKIWLFSCFRNRKEV